MAVTATSDGHTMRGCNDSPPPRSHSYITATITVQPQPMAAVTHCRRGCIATMTASHAGTAVSCDTVMVTSQHQPHHNRGRIVCTEILCTETAVLMAIHCGTHHYFGSSH